MRDMRHLFRDKPPAGGGTAAAPFTRLLMLCVLCVLTFPLVAQAGTQRARDGDDRPGPLDIRLASSAHVSGAMRHTITTFAPWRTGLIGSSTPHFLAIGIDLRGSQAFDEFVFFGSRNGSLRAFLITPDGRIIRRLRASRPNGRSVSALIPLAHFAQQGAYSWAALSVFGTTGGSVVDWAPNRRALRHDAFRPKIELISFPDPSTAASDWTTVNVTFSISDPGTRATGIRAWTVQSRRDDGSWETWGWLEDAGHKTVTVGGLEGGNWRLRVVARDGHGNTTFSPHRLVSIPWDDTNGKFADAWSGSWTSVALVGSPYMGNFRETTTPGSAFTYTFEGSTFMWIGPGAPNGGPGTATVTIDGGAPTTVEQQAVAGDRAVIFMATGLDPAVPHTIAITHQSGKIAFDGIVIR